MTAGTTCLSHLPVGQKSKCSTGHFSPSPTGVAKERTPPNNRFFSLSLSFLTMYSSTSIFKFNLGRPLWSGSFRRIPDVGRNGARHLSMLDIAQGTGELDA